MFSFRMLFFAACLMAFSGISHAGLFDVIFPDPRDVVPGVEELLEGDVCGATPGCTAIDFHIRSCLIDYDRDSCATSIVLPNFIEDCKLAGGLIHTVYEAAVDRDLGDVVDQNNMYFYVEAIFDVGMSTPGFANYVRNNVNHYKINNSLLPGGGRATRNNIYYDSSNPSRELIIHELVHVWQYYTQGQTDLAEGICEDIAREQELPRYEFVLNPSKSFLDYGIEQQAEIVENYHRIVHNGGTICDSEGNFLNCQSYLGNSARLIDDFEQILGTAVLTIHTIDYLMPRTSDFTEVTLRARHFDENMVVGQDNGIAGEQFWYNHNHDRYGNSSRYEWDKPTNAKTEIQFKIINGKSGRTASNPDYDWTRLELYNENITSAWLPVLPGSFFDDFMARRVKLPYSKHKNTKREYILVYYRLRFIEGNSTSPWHNLKPIWLHTSD